MSSRKRSLSPAREMEKLMKKVKKLEERVQAASARLQNKDSSAGESSQEHRDPDPSDSSSPEDDSSEKNEEEKVEKKEEEVETEDEEWAEIIGENPKNSGAQITTVKSDLLEIWKFFCTEGMKKEAEEALIAKYVCREEFNAPTLNPQITSMMKESSKTRDRYMATIEKLAGLSLSVIGSIMTNIYDHRDEGVDIIDILTPLKDAGDLLSLIINKQSKNRKAFIEPGLSKESSAILKETSIDEFLYGKDLSGKIKEMKAFSREGEGLAKATPTSATPRSLNQNTPYSGRQRAGFTNTRGRQKQKLYFRGSQQYNQQFVNRRAQAPRGRGSSTRSAARN
ncbi:hypothetical protein TKK_0013488 [Trichogramma kaykai]